MSEKMKKTESSTEGKRGPPVKENKALKLLATMREHLDNNPVCSFACKSPIHAKAAALTVTFLLLFIPRFYSMILGWIGTGLYLIFCAHFFSFLWRYFPELLDSLRHKVPIVEMLVSKIEKFQGKIDQRGVKLGYPAAIKGDSPTVLITGGAMGIGKEIAKQFVDMNYRVILWDINPSALETTSNELLSRGKGGAVITSVVDVGDDDSVQQAASDIKTSVDILVLNAGVVAGGRYIDKTTESEVSKVFRVNVLHLFNVSRALIPRMKADSVHNKHIVVIGSIAGYAGAAYLADYNASKAAANSFAESLHAELRGLPHMRVSLVCPYLVDTGMFNGAKRLCGLAFLTPLEVAEHVVRVIKFKKDMVVIPWIFHGLLFCKAAVPWWALVYLDKALGASTCMTTFVGRPSSPKRPAEKEEKIE